jgi:hypothetical protein
MIGMAILQPVVALAAWTMAMWFWMYATRIPAIGAAKIDLDAMVRDPETSLDDLLPVGVQWKAHNYNHLHEAPTVFYAIAIVLAVIGQGDGLNAQLGWAYHRPFRIICNVEPGAAYTGGARSYGDVLDHRDYRTNRLASSTWVDHRNWPTGRSSWSV